MQIESKQQSNKANSNLNLWHPGAMLQKVPDDHSSHVMSIRFCAEPSFIYRIELVHMKPADIRLHQQMLVAPISFEGEFPPQCVDDQIL